MLSWFPLVGQQFSKPGLGMAADACEDIVQVSEGIAPQPLRGGDQAREHGRGVTAVVTAIKHPVFSAYRDAAQAALGTIIVNLQVAVVRVAGQRMPIRQRVGEGLPFRALGQHRGWFSLQISTDVVPNRLGFLLSQRPASLSVELPVAGFALHLVEQADIGEHYRRTHQVRRLRLEKAPPRMGPAGNLENAARRLLIEMIVPGVRVGLQIPLKLL